MKQIIAPTSNNEQHNTFFLSSCLPESRFFLYQRYFSKNKNRIKLVGRSITYSYDKIRKDYFISVGYGLKNFFIFNTNIIQTLRKNNSNFPLKTTSLLQQRSKNLSIFEKHINFKSHQDFRYRNLAIKLKPFKNQIWLQKTSLLTKPLNKTIFFSMFKTIQNLSLNSTIFVLYRTWKTNLVRIYHLGFRFLLENAPIKRTITKYINKEPLKKKTNSKLAEKLTYKKMLLKKKHICSKNKSGYNKLLRIKKKFIDINKGGLCIKRVRSLFLKRKQIIKIASPIIYKRISKKLKIVLERDYFNKYMHKTYYYSNRPKKVRQKKIKKFLKKNLKLLKKKTLKKRILLNWKSKTKNKRKILKNKINIRLRFVYSKRKLIRSVHSKKVDYQHVRNKYKRKITSINSKKIEKKKTILNSKKGFKKVMSLALATLNTHNFARNF